MSRLKLYRTLSAAVVSAAAILFVGCCDAVKSQQTMKAEQYNRWNMTRVGIMCQLAEQQYAVGDYDKCRKTLEEAFALKAAYAPLHTLAGKVELEKGSLELAADHLKDATRIDPTGPEPFYLLGVVYQRWQNAETAADYYQQAWDRKPGEARYMLAVVEMKITTGHLDEAQKILESKLVYFEQSAAVRIALARIAVLKSDHRTACNYYRDAVILTPDDSQLRRSYAEELFYSGKYSDAAAIFEDMRKDKDLVDGENLLLMLGEAYMNLNRPFDARNCYQEITRTNPNNLLAYVALAKACMETGDLGIALAATRKVIHAEPDNTQALVLLALVQQKERKWSDSEGTLAKAATLVPADCTVLCMMGINEEQLGNHDAAVALYKKATAGSPANAWANELLNKSQPGADAPQAKAMAASPPAAATAIGSNSIIQADSATIIQPENKSNP